MKNRILSLTLALLLLLSISVCAFADETVSGAKNGVAVLATFFKGDSMIFQGGSGSCFFIGVPGENPQYLLTNHHVISDYLQYRAGKTGSFSIDGVNMSGKMILRVYYSQNDYEEAYFIASDEAQDVALLRLAKPTSKRVALPLCEKVDNSMVGDSVYAIGYPAYANLIDATSSMSAEDSMVTNGSISRLVIESGTGAQWIEFAATEWGHGNSGGPVVTSDGTVVGIVSHGQALDATVYRAVNVESTFSMLKNNNIQIGSKPAAGTPAAEPAEPETPAAEPTEPVTQPATQTAVEPATQPATQTAVEPATQPAVEPAKGFQIEPWMIAAAVAALLAIILLVVLLSRKKKPQPEVSSVASGGGASTVVNKQVTPFIRSLAAQHGGMRVQIGAQPVMIGRQDDCVIRFQSGTPGVSRVHCQVAWDPVSKEFILTDLKSSYGTFLETGQRLAPHTPIRLRSGDSFYVGDKANILRVEASET
ncbi:MAG: trypsin-like peptidase domain-containing protein [Oscillospiraceae bacterium]|nr:trypsin-like peptidase domain-containing protein [Oscillospiraceae bacterium]